MVQSWFDLPGGNMSRSGKLKLSRETVILLSEFSSLRTVVGGTTTNEDSLANVQCTRTMLPTCVDDETEQCPG
jgi:hypothetical protein